MHRHPGLPQTIHWRLPKRYLVPKTLLAETDTAVNVAEGDVIALNYNEEGTGTFVLLSVQLDVTY